ncbi:MAG: hypothetical protein LUC85_10140, partial [Bacteroidales bacterium]|nr:hypothetical protein [Bacteroidales bacterium]
LPKSYLPKTYEILFADYNNALVVKVDGRVAKASDPAATLEAYTPGGSLVSRGRGEIMIPAQGLWIVRAVTPGYITSTKVVVE